jgi:predicted TIM-barrel fold metal-dependent hydrolase
MPPGLSTLSPSRRYQPDYEATPDALIETLTKHGLGKALIVQPSFLGTDNTYLLDALARYPNRFRGVAVIDPSVDRETMQHFAEGSVVGIRLNAIGAPVPDLGSATYRKFARLLAKLDPFLEIQAEGNQWNDMASRLSDLPCELVIDHFGRTPVTHGSGGFELAPERPGHAPPLS